MSELKVYSQCYDGTDGLFYLKSEADEVIDELKVKLRVQTSNAEDAWKLKDSYHSNYAEAVKELYEKNKEIAQLQAMLEERNSQIAKLTQSLEQVKRAARTLRKKMYNEKRKRCLKMAELCCEAYDKWMMRKVKAIGIGKDGVEEYHQARRKLFHYMRWQKRWLELAEQFKEAK